MSGQQFIDRARALDKVATEGRWEVIPTVGNAVVAPCEGHWVDVADRIEAEADAEFIAAARSMLPAAVEALARVRELHAPEEYDDPAGELFCRTCGDWNLCADPLGLEPIWPCPTVRAIDQATEVEA